MLRRAGQSQRIHGFQPMERAHMKRGSSSSNSDVVRPAAAKVPRVFRCPARTTSPSPKVRNPTGGTYVLYCVSFTHSSEFLHSNGYTIVCRHVSCATQTAHMHPAHRARPVLTATDKGYIKGWKTKTAICRAIASTLQWRATCALSCATGTASRCPGICTWHGLRVYLREYAAGVHG